MPCLPWLLRRGDALHFARQEVTVSNDGIFDLLVYLLFATELVCVMGAALQLVSGVVLQFTSAPTGSKWASSCGRHPCTTVLSKSGPKSTTNFKCTVETHWEFLQRLVSRKEVANALRRGGGWFSTAQAVPLWPLARLGKTATSLSCCRIRAGLHRSSTKSILGFESPG